MGTVKLVPSFQGPENSEFWKWVPSGKIELGPIDADALGRFRIGREYYVDFSETHQEKPTAKKRVTQRRNFKRKAR